MSAVRSVYKVIRSIFFTTLLVVAGLVVALYITVSIPSVADAIKKRAESELTAFLGGEVEISSVDIMPFNELRLHGVSIYTPKGERCISIGRLGAGVSLWTLVTDGSLEFTYAELISMNARVTQAAPDSPLNIDFIIKALSPKKKKKKPTVKVALRNVVIRKSAIQFDRLYVPELADGRRLDPAHLRLDNFRADLEIPYIDNGNFAIDLRRLAFTEKSGLVVNGLSLKADISPSKIELSDLHLLLDNSEITISDQSLSFDGYSHIVDALKKGSHTVRILAEPFVPSELACLYPPLASLDNPFKIGVSVTGNLNGIDIASLSVDDMRSGFMLSLAGHVDGLRNPKSMSGHLERLSIDAPGGTGDILSSLIPGLRPKVRELISDLGDVKVKAGGNFNLDSKNADVVAEILSNAGNVSLKSDLLWSPAGLRINDFAVKADAVNIGLLTSDDKFGLASAEAEGSVSFEKGLLEGSVRAAVPMLDFNSNRLENINARLEKTGEEVMASLSVDSRLVSLVADADCLVSGSSSLWNLDAEISHLYPSALGVSAFRPGDNVSGKISLDLSGNTPDNLAGRVSLDNLNYNSAKNFHLDNLTVTADVSDDDRSYSVSSDFLRGDIRGSFSPSEAVALVRNSLSEVVPDFIRPVSTPVPDSMHAEMNISVIPDDRLYSILGSGIRPGVPVGIVASLSGRDRRVALSVDAPYLVQGKDKLIKNLNLNVERESGRPAELKLSGSYPLKNDRAEISLNASAIDGNGNCALWWSMEGNRSNTGKVNLSWDTGINPLTGTFEAIATMFESGFMLNGSEWLISPSSVEYADKSLRVNGIRVSHGLQFIDINGSASSDPMDVVEVNLAGIDLDYVFSILNINHVDFGGIASGKARVSSLFTKAPVAATDGLFVKNLAYNGCVLGDGRLESHWDNENRMVAINADISAPEDAWAAVRGGVYVTRDSLSFDFNANKLDIRFLQPFMDGFTSSVEGRASGHVKLYGTFSDIDLGGRVKADTITMKVDYTNVCYSGSDSVFFSPGRISIPSIRLYDKYGNSCLMSGVVRHNCLHDASFDFNVSDVRNMLVYDTGPKMNPRWYGHIFASGQGSLKGTPGLVRLNLNMSTSRNSEFTLVLDETQEAVDYAFLTFTDRRKKDRESEIVVKESFEDRLRRKNEHVAAERPDLFVLDLALDVSPGAKMVIVMDPAAGDKISAYGNGALQMHYDSDSDDFSIYGKYTLARGDYNFSLQDLILKNFKIEEGSSISFNGDPLQGLLDITAAYRVNTSLTDLDLSFQSDPDLKRTTVPVDALLKVTGDIHAPEINFDIKLPTVTAEVERKVHSIISTKDMMNRQVIYLLALNRFYSPEYMGTSQGGEFASVASSTLSSQIQNILGSLTDKFSLSPSFKSDKSDLSDMEVDVALSSSLFDNRLLINGNLGYRDKSTSQTTFVGDFDLEYLLSRDGRLRLKAYNHFNDASYYLKSALTTQGIGVIYRKDFDDPFTFIKRWLRRKKKSDAEHSREKTKK